MHRLVRTRKRIIGTATAVHLDKSRSTLLILVFETSITLHLSIKCKHTNKYNHSPKYSSTSAFFRRSSRTFSISSLEGSFGGKRSFADKKGIRAAAACAPRNTASSIPLLSGWPEPFVSTAIPSAFGLFVGSLIAVASSDASVISVSPSGAFRFASACPFCSWRSCMGRKLSRPGSGGAGSLSGIPRTAFTLEYASSHSESKKLR